jgi:hypothetical protein
MATEQFSPADPQTMIEHRHPVLDTRPPWSGTAASLTPVPAQRGPGEEHWIDGTDLFGATAALGRADSGDRVSKRSYQTKTPQVTAAGTTVGSQSGAVCSRTQHPLAAVDHCQLRRGCTFGDHRPTDAVFRVGATQRATGASKSTLAVNGRGHSLVSAIFSVQLMSGTKPNIGTSKTSQLIRHRRQAAPAQRQRIRLNQKNFLQ